MPGNCVKTDAGRSFKLPKNPQYVVCFDMQFVFGGCYRAEIFVSFLFLFFLLLRL